jgi:CRP-like cAMP-binding protein
MNHSSPLASDVLKGNHLLAALPVASLQRLSSELRPTLFHTGTILFERDSPCEAVFFPKSGILSLTLTSATGIDVEVGLVGPEGVAGALDVVGGGNNSTRGQVQIAGSGWKLPAAVLLEEFGKDAAFRHALLAHQRSLSSIASQNTLCNRLHSIEQRLAKWLLLARDRVQSDDLELTHEFIATMLGSRREAVTLSLQSLREVGVISAQRGCVTILDRVGLEHLACECYPLLKQQFQQQSQQAT